MNTKLAINLSEGTVHVEGDEQFVRSVYQDFKEFLSKQATRPPVIETITPKAEPPAQIADETPRKKRVSARKSSRSEGDKPRMNDYKPVFRSELNLKDLEAAYDAFGPDNHNEKILLFAVFLRDELKVSPCTADHIYTCYRTMKDKTVTPEAFVQAFRTAENRTHYIEFVSPQEIKVTIAGDNFYSKKLQQKNGAAK